MRKSLKNDRLSMVSRYCTPICPPPQASPNVGDKVADCHHLLYLLSNRLHYRFAKKGCFLSFSSTKYTKNTKISCFSCRSWKNIINPICDTVHYTPPKELAGRLLFVNVNKSRNETQWNDGTLFCRNDQNDMKLSGESLT